MKTKKTRGLTPVKTAIIIVSAVILVTGAYTAFAYTQSWWPFNNSQNDNTLETPAEDTPADSDDTDNEKPNDEDEIVKEGEDIKKNNVDPGDAPDATSSDFTVKLLPSSSGTGKLTVGTLISKVTNSGTCSLTLTKAGSSKITRSVGIQAAPSYSTCKFESLTGVDSGTWNATVKVTISGKSVSATKEVTVQ